MNVLDQTYPRYREKLPVCLTAFEVADGMELKVCLAAVNTVSYGALDEVSPHQILVPVSAGRPTFVGLVVRSFSGEHLDGGIGATVYRRPWLEPVDPKARRFVFSDHSGRNVFTYILDGSRRSLELWVKSGIGGGFMGKVDLLVNPWVSR